MCSRLLGKRITWVNHGTHGGEAWNAFLNWSTYISVACQAVKGAIFVDIVSVGGLTTALEILR